MGWSLVLRQLLFLVVLVASYRAQSTSASRTLAAEIPGASTSCRNTKQGMYLMADDKGKVCGRHELDYATGCCKGGAQHACDRCHPDDGCCSELEYCVSCCMAPQNNAAERMKAAPRIRERPEFGHWEDPFSFCVAICRTHRRSTVHENSYLSHRHHCFSPLGKPMLHGPTPKELTTGNVTVLASATGESCTAACQRASLHCAPALLQPLDSCDRLREHLPCEAGCGRFTPQPFHPAYVDPSAPKNMRPAICMVTTPSQPHQPSCDASEQQIQRLCPCVPQPPPAGADTAAAAAGANPAHLRGGGAGGKEGGGEKMH